MNSPEKTEFFVQQIAEHQNRLHGYVFSLLGDHSRAADVLQETNMVLWRKIGEFDMDKPFLPWAFTIARFQVLAHLRDSKRERVLLDAELVESISAFAEKQASRVDLLQEAIRPCLETLSDNNRELIAKKYLRSMSVRDIATAMDRTVGAVKLALLRSRRHLADCVQLRLAAEGER